MTPPLTFLRNPYLINLLPPIGPGDSDFSTLVLALLIAL